MVPPSSWLAHNNAAATYRKDALGQGRRTLLGCAARRTWRPQADPTPQRRRLMCVRTTHGPGPSMECKEYSHKMQVVENQKKSDLVAIDCQRRERSWTLSSCAIQEKIDGRTKKEERETQQLSVGNNYESGGEKGPIFSSRNWSENAASLVHPLNGCHEEDMRTRA